MNTVVKLKPGLQAPPVPVSNTTYVPDGGQVIFNAPIKGGNLSNVIFDGTGLGAGIYGFKYAGPVGGGAFTTGSGNNQFIQLLGFDFDVAGYVLDSQTLAYMPDGKTILTFNGKPETAAHWGPSVKGCRFGNKTMGIRGTYAAPTTYQMIICGAVFEDILVYMPADGSGSFIRWQGNSIYGFKVRRVNMTGPSTSPGDGGAIFITGTAEVDGFYQDGPWGYVMRLIICQIDGIPFDQTCIGKNSISTRTTHYGMWDVKIQTDQINSKGVIPIRGANFLCDHNTAGDKKDDGTYITPMCVVGDMRDETGKQFNWTISNNFAYNAMVHASNNNSSLFVNFSPNQMPPAMNNNVDLAPGVPLPGGYLIDTKGFVPVANGPLDGKGSGGTDIGAVQNTAPVKQRTVVSMTSKIVTTYTYLYDDGSTSTMTV